MLRAAIEDPDAAQAGIKATQSLVLGYCDQALAGLADADTPMRTIVRRFDVGDQRARALLAGAGLSIEMQGRPIGQLSGGQKARLGMLLLRLAQPNFYLLDEPTNHLDIEGQEALEEELMDHQASCLLVSHDRNFVRTVGNRFWLIDRQEAGGTGGAGGVLCIGRRNRLAARPAMVLRTTRCAKPALTLARPVVERPLCGMPLDRIQHPSHDDFTIIQMPLTCPQSARININLVVSADGEPTSASRMSSSSNCAEHEAPL